MTLSTRTRPRHRKTRGRTATTWHIVPHVPYEHPDVPGVCGVCGIPLYARTSARHITTEQLIERLVSTGPDAMSLAAGEWKANPRGG